MAPAPTTATRANSELQSDIGIFRILKGDVERRPQGRWRYAENAGPIDHLEYVRRGQGLELADCEGRVAVHESICLQHEPEEAIRKFDQSRAGAGRLLHRTHQIDVVDPFEARDVEGLA